MSDWSHEIANQATPRSMGFAFESRTSTEQGGLTLDEHARINACERAIAEMLLDQALGRALIVGRMGCAYFLAPVAHEAVALMATECVAGVPLLDGAREAWLVPYEGSSRLTEIREALAEALAEPRFVAIDWSKAVHPGWLAL